MIKHTTILKFKKVKISSHLCPNITKIYNFFSPSLVHRRIQIRNSDPTDFHFLDPDQKWIILDPEQIGLAKCTSCYNHSLATANL